MYIDQPGGFPSLQPTAPADLPMGILPNSGELVFLQMDGDLSQEDFKIAWDYNMEAASHIHEIMARALKGGDA